MKQDLDKITLQLLMNRTLESLVMDYDFKHIPERDGRFWGQRPGNLIPRWWDVKKTVNQNKLIFLYDTKTNKLGYGKYYNNNTMNEILDMRVTMYDGQCAILTPDLSIDKVLRYYGEQLEKMVGI